MLQQWVRWLIGLFKDGALLFVLGAFLIPPSTVVYDLARFHQVRSYVNRILAELSPDERAPNAAVQRAFGRHAKKGFSFHGRVSYQACVNEVCGDYGELEEKLEGWLLWTPLLRVLYSKQEMFGVYLHTNGRLAGERGAGRISRIAFGRDLNQLSARELILPGTSGSGPSSPF